MKAGIIKGLLYVLATLLLFNSIYGAYTSVELYPFDIDDVTFDSSTYVTIENVSTNFSSVRNVTFKGSLNAQKSDVATSTDLYMKLIFNNVTLFDESLRTIENLKDRGVVNIPITTTEGISGENNIVIQVRDTGNGGITISDFHLHAQTDVTTAGGVIQRTIGNTILNLTNDSYVNLLNITINKDVSSYTGIDVQQTVSATDLTTVTCYLECFNTSDRTPYYQRYISGSSDTGSTGVFYRSNTTSTGAEQWGLYCKGSNLETITNDIHYILFELGDSLGNTINSEQAVNASTNITSSTILSEGVNILTSLNLTIQEGVEPVLEGMFVGQSTSGAQEDVSSPTFYFYNVVASTCSLDYVRSFSSNADIGTSKIYSHCQNTTVNDTYEYQLRINVSAGETLRILDESLFVYEALIQNTSSSNLPPILSITHPDENETVSGNLYVTATMNDLDGDTLSTNLTLTNGVEYQVVEGSSATSLSQLIDTGYYTDGDYILNLTTCEVGTPELYCTTVLRNFTIQNAINVGGGSSASYKEVKFNPPVPEEPRVDTSLSTTSKFIELFMGYVFTLLLTLFIFPRNAKLKLRKVLGYYGASALVVSPIAYFGIFEFGTLLLLGLAIPSAFTLVLFARNGNRKLKRFIIIQSLVILIIIITKLIM